MVIPNPQAVLKSYSQDSTPPQGTSSRAHSCIMSIVFAAQGMNSLASDTPLAQAGL